MIHLLLLALLSYLLGSVPSAYIAGKIKKGFDIRDHGSGNVGATNTLVTIGAFAALFVYVFDLFKGLFPVLMAKHFFGTEFAMGLAGLAAVVGHDFPVFLGFKGGKGVATMTGAMFGINAVIMWILIAAWIIFVFTTDYFIVSSLLCMFFLPVLMCLFRLSSTYVAFGVLYLMLGVFTHWQDIAKIRAGQGPRALASVRKFLKK
jgi:acyl phosphate:glycerol-3-phosphate acyltransferase